MSVRVVDCPDLTKPPFHLVSPGLGGNPRIFDIGGVANLTPCLNKVLYNLVDATGSGERFLIGAGAGPFDFIGRNCEMMTNLSVGADGTVVNGSRVAFMTSEKDYKLEKLPDDQPRCGLMMNLLVSEGKPCKVRLLECRVSICCRDFGYEHGRFFLSRLICNNSKACAS